MGGNADAYEKQKRIFSAAAQVGTAICGAYTAAKGGNVCFVAGTQVETADGSTAIEISTIPDYYYRDLQER